VETFGVVFALVSLFWVPNRGRKKKRSLHGLIVAGPVLGEFWAKPICDKRKSLRSRIHEFGELVVGRRGLSS
jgi:hypothetical protein